MASTNPEVVAYLVGACSFQKLCEAEDWADDDEAIEPLIRLSDYRALQADHDKLPLDIAKA